MYEYRLRVHTSISHSHHSHLIISFSISILFIISNLVLPPFQTPLCNLTIPTPLPPSCIYIFLSYLPFSHKRLNESLEHHYPNLTSIDSRLLYKLTFPFSRPCSLPSSRSHGKQNIEIGFYPAGHHPAIINITDIIQSLCVLTCQPSVLFRASLADAIDHELEVPYFIALISPRSLHHTLSGAA